MTRIEIERLKELVRQDEMAETNSGYKFARSPLRHWQAMELIELAFKGIKNERRV